MRADAAIERLETRIAPAFAPVFALSSLDGDNGFKLSGAGVGECSGNAVSAAGDVNGDGFVDLIIGAYCAAPNGENSGASYVIFGDASGFAADLKLSALNGSNGFKISGVAAHNRTGRSVSAAGDVNGDGFDDLIVGADLAAANGYASGASYVIFGKSSGFTSNLHLSMLDGNNGFKLSGAAVGDRSGYAVSGAGDVNGDGFADLIIGAPYADPNGSGSGESYVVFGKADGFAANINLATLNGTNGFRIRGAAYGDISGVSVSDAGDVNGDGFADVIIGASRADPGGFNYGASYVVFGKASGFSASLNLSTLDGTDGFKLSGVAHRDYCGASVSDAGDVNGDGFGDIIIGAVTADPNGGSSGASYVVFGKASGFGANLNLSSLTGTNGFKLSGVAAYDFSGESVSAAGDVNGDGFDDVIIGARGANSTVEDSGASYVIFGKMSGFAANLNLSALNGSNGFKLQGVAEDDESGIAVSTAGDVNGDGFDDLLVGAVKVANFSGATYVVFGQGVELSINDAIVSEGNTGTTSLQFTVLLSEPAGLTPVSVQVATVDGSALSGGDFAPLGTGTITFAPGETSKSISIEVLADVTFESDETFSVMLSAANGGVIRDALSVGTIVNDDAPPLVNIAGGSVLEGDAGATGLTFNVSLSAASGLPVTMQVRSENGTAFAGSDYTALVPGTLTFASGETSKTVVVEVLGDTNIEDHENFSAVLSEASGATISTGTAIATILNDDTALRITGTDGIEGGSGPSPFAFTINLEAPSALQVTVSYETADGTASAGSDYGAVLLTQLTFAAGETTKTIHVNVLGDTEVEPHETFSVILSGASGALIAEGIGKGTILNDETLVRIADASQLEGHRGMRAMTFTVSLSEPTALPVSVNFASADGTAAAGADYTALMPGTLGFAPGETSKTIAVDVLGDIAIEESETFSVMLSEAVDAVIDDAVGTGRILDDDVALVGARKATFTDVDGELVTIKVSKGTLKVEDFTIVPAGEGARLALVDFSGETEFAGANLKITARKMPGGAAGDKLVNVGYIDATGVDLGVVMVKGDLGQIDAGNDADPKPGVLSLRASSLGRQGLATQLPGGSMQSDISGVLKTLKLGGDMQDTTLSVTGGIGAIAVKGSVLGGVIRSDEKIGTIQIAGDLAAGASGEATISARGILAPSGTKQALAMRSVTIGGSVSEANLLAGYDRTGAPVNADVGIGVVKVGGDWRASDLVAGVAAGADGFFGTDDDALIAAPNAILARIALVVIKGTAAGTEGGADHFGFVAEQIDAFKAGGTRLSLTPGAGNDVGISVGTTGDLLLREIA